MVKIKCPCCGNGEVEREIADEPYYDICPVCEWEDCNEETCNNIWNPNHMSIKKFRRNYQKRCKVQ
jgi:hypothetical protein